MMIWLLYYREADVLFSLTRHSCNILETLASCVKFKEPVLLVGETGVGKTCSIQYLASTLNQKLVVVNLNRQSDAGDILGGYGSMNTFF